MTDKEKEIIEKYNYLSEDDGIFMNDGYCPLNRFGLPIDFIDIDLIEKYKPWKYQVYLYKVLLDTINIHPINSKNKSLLDVGCGRGGGLSFYNDYYKFDKLVGIDLNPTHKKIAENHTENINFLTSSATKIPLDDNSFDIITCVESSPYYEPFTNYVKEISRLLKDGGIYVRTERYMQNPDEFLSHGFQIIKERDITQNTRMSCAISKWSSLYISRRLSTVFFNDEEEYIEDRAFYNIRAYRKILN